MLVRAEVIVRVEAEVHLGNTRSIPHARTQSLALEAIQENPTGMDHHITSQNHAQPHEIVKLALRVM